MIDFIRDNQLNIMLCLSSICLILSLFVFLTGVTGRKRRALLMLELGATFLLMSDRYAIMYDGDTSTLGYYLVRINTFIDYIMSLEVFYAFNMYLQEMFAESDGLNPNLKRFKFNKILMIIGSALIVFSQFTNFYYSFDENNVYSRGPGFLFCYLLPFGGLILSISLIIQYYKRLPERLRLSVLLFTLIPLCGAIIQLFIYGIETINISIVGMAVVLYIFDLRHMNRTAGMSARAIAANEAKSSFLSSMSHEIRTPINAILGMNEMILRECHDEKVLEYSENIRAAGNTLLGLINDILDFSKIEAGKIEIIPLEYDLSSMINDLVNMIHSRAEEKELELKLNFNKKLPRYLYGDEVRIKQIITNILTNAVKYTEKGSITFSMDFDKDGKDPLCVILKVSVEDTGIGIKEKDMEKLFTKFERIEELRNRKIEGTGLGMSITQSLLEMMGSKLCVESTYGKGSVFYFDLKQRIRSFEVLGDYEKSYKEHVSRQRKFKEKIFAPDARILVVDDNQMNLVVFENLVKQTQIAIDTAMSGDEGIALSKKKRYDIIFLDHMMPGKDGIETLHAINNNPDDKNHGVHKICLTANAIFGAKEKYMSEGFNDYLSKPIDPDKLESLLIKHLPKEKLKIIAKEECEEDGVSIECGIPDEISCLKDQTEIDIEIGLKNNGDADAFVSVLRLFYESLDEKISEIEHFLADGNTHDYTVKVHALKSTLKIIGATKAGKDAQLLEDAGKENNLSYIHANCDKFMDRCRRISDSLAELFADNYINSIQGNSQADDSLMTVMYKEIASAAAKKDREYLLNIFAEMEEYIIPDEYAEIYEKLKTAAESGDFEKLEQLLS